MLLNDGDLAAMDELTAEAERVIGESGPESQSYFQRMDNGKIVKTESEYHRCQQKGVKLQVVPYALALMLLNREDAKRNERKAKKERRKAKRRR